MRKAVVANAVCVKPSRVDRTQLAGSSPLIRLLFMFPASKKHQGELAVAAATTAVRAQRVVASPMPDSLAFCLPNIKCMPPLPVGMEGVPLVRWKLFWIKANTTLSSVRGGSIYDCLIPLVTIVIIMIALSCLLGAVDLPFDAISGVLMVVVSIACFVNMCRQHRLKEAMEIEAIKALCQDEEQAIFQRLGWSLHVESAQSGSEEGQDVFIVFRRINAVVGSRSKVESTDEEVA
jgi:hypothetical protein